METSATRGCEHGRACDDYCPECEIDGLSDTIVKLRAEITRLIAENAALREFLDEMARRGGDGHWFTDQYNEFRAAIDAAKQRQEPLIKKEE